MTRAGNEPSQRFHNHKEGIKKSEANNNNKEKVLEGDFSVIMKSSQMFVSSSSVLMTSLTMTLVQNSQKLGTSLMEWQRTMMTLM